MAGGDEQILAGGGGVEARAFSRPHAVAIPLPAQGHLNPLMRLCRALASHHGFFITFVNIDPIHNRILHCNKTNPTTPNIAAGTSLPSHSSSANNPSFLEEEDAGHGSSSRTRPLPIRRVSLPIHGLDLGNDFRLSIADFLIATRSLSSPLETLLQRMVRKEDDNAFPPVTCLISDSFMAAAVQHVAEKLAIPWVSYFPSSQSMNLLYFYTHMGRIPLEEVIRLSINRAHPLEVFKDDLPGLPPRRNRDMPPHKHVVEESSRLIPIMVDLCQIANEKASAIVVNTFEEIEGDAMQAMAGQLTTSRLFGVGPLVDVLEKESSTSLWKEENHCLQWLDVQPACSVLYISFGSITLLSQEQFVAIVDGLQASGQRFLWAFRPDLVEGHERREAIDNHNTLLPEEVVEAMRGRACFVEWAPQVRVLNHPSVGGFLTHCGWNSTLEAIAAGVPMLCWPYLCDQHINTKFIVEVWQVGLRFEPSPSKQGGFVDSREVARVVQALMEGEAGVVLHKHSASLRQSALSSLQAAGYFHRQLQAFVQHICNISS